MPLESLAVVGVHALVLMAQTFTQTFYPKQNIVTSKPFAAPPNRRRSATSRLRGGPLLCLGQLAVEVVAGWLSRGVSQVVERSQNLMGAEASAKGSQGGRGENGD